MSAIGISPQLAALGDCNEVVREGLARKPQIIVSRWFVPPGAAAWTLLRWIFVRPTKADDAYLLAHECVHVAQWNKLGVAGFLRAYLSAYFRARLAGDRHWEAYATIPLEVEAARIQTELMAESARA